MDSYFILVRTHQHGIASTVSLTITDPAFTAEVSAKHSFIKAQAPPYTCGSCCLGTASSSRQAYEDGISLLLISVPQNL